MKNKKNNLHRIFYIAMPVLLASLFSMPTFAADYNLSSGPFTIEEVGQTFNNAIIQGASLPEPVINGQRHYVAYWWAGNLPIQILDINLVTGESRVIDAPATGRPGMGPITHSNNIAYAVGSQNYMFSYNPSTGQAHSIGKLSDNNGEQIMIEGDNHLVYIGQCCQGRVDWYDPSTDTKGDFGIINDPHPTSYFRYAYFVGGGNGYLYVSVRDEARGWSLTVLQLDASGKIKVAEKNLFSNIPALTPEGSNVFLNVLKGQDGNWYMRNSDKLDAYYTEGKWYKLNGLNDPELMSAAPTLSSYYFQPSIQMTKWAGSVDSGTNGVATFQWTMNGQTLSASPQFKLSPIPNKRLFAPSDSASQLLGWANTYNGEFSYDIPNDKTNYLSVGGLSSGSHYDALYSNNLWYLSGYPHVFQSFDPAKPVISGINPLPLPIEANANAHYLYFMARGADGLIYLAGHFERIATGGSIGWYDPKTGTYGGDRNDFINYDPSDMIATEGGTKMVMAGYSLATGVDNALLVFDTATKQLVKTIPLPGRSMGKLVEAEPGKVVVVNKKTAPYEIYKVDTNTGQILFDKKVSERPLSLGTYYNVDHLVKGPDGYAWMYSGTYLSRLNMQTGEVEHVIADAGPGGNPVFLKNGQGGYDIYLDGAGLVYNIRRIKNVLTSGSGSPADINQDNSVNLADFDILKSDFLKLTAGLSNPKSDIDGDGQATVKDVGILMSGWRL